MKKKKNSISISVFGCEEIHANPFLIGEKNTWHYCSYQRFQYILIRLYILFWKKTILLLLLLQAFSTQEILKHNINDCIKINGKQRIIMPKKAEYIKFYNFEEKK